MPEFEFQMSLLRLCQATAEMGHIFPTAPDQVDSPSGDPIPDSIREEIAVLAVLARDAGSRED